MLLFKLEAKKGKKAIAPGQAVKVVRGALRYCMA